MKTCINSIILVLVAIVYSVAQAVDTSPATADTVSASPAAGAPAAGAPAAGAPAVAPNSGLTVTGYIEAYYTHDFTAPKTSQQRPGFLYNHVL